MVPPAPPSLVKFAAAASPRRASGVARSTPTSDHVPDEMNAQPGVERRADDGAGGVVRRRRDHADRLAPGSSSDLAQVAGRSAPRSVPGSTSAGISAARQPELREQRVVPRRASCAFSSCVVEALVYSPLRDPLRKR